MYGKIYPVLPPQKGVLLLHLLERVGSTPRCYYGPSMKDMGVKNTSRARFPLKLRMLGVDPSASRGCFGELGLSFDSLMAGTGLSQHITCERRTERDSCFGLFPCFQARVGGVGDC